MRWFRRILAAVLVLAAMVYLNNTSLFTAAAPGEPTILAHRGVAQRYSTEGLDNDTCTARRILPPEHDYLENTIASMRESFARGADIVEIDVHPTTDGHFAGFHDWTLDCRTDGTGVTREHSLAELKALDIGYGYTADGGETYPFRGKGVGLMPSLDEVLASFPDRRFLINVKSNDPAEGVALSDALAAYPPERRARLMVYGGDAPVDAFAARNPGVKTVSRGRLETCLLRYAAFGWTGIVPPACRTALVLVPVNVAPWLWGWPDRFIARMRDAGSAVFALGPYTGGGFSTGIDSRADLDRLPPGYAAGIWTNEPGLVAGAAGGAPGR